MWAFLSRRFRTYLMFAVGAPLVAYGLDKVGGALERRRGPSGVTRTLRSGGDWLRRHGRGPLAARLRREDAPDPDRDLRAA